MYVYVKSEPSLFTVGFYHPDGKWEPESDHPTREEAAERTAWLNGGPRPISAFGNRVEKLLEEKGMFKDELAEKMEISQTALTNMLRSKSPHHRTVRKISEILGVEMTFFSDLLN